MTFNLLIQQTNEAFDAVSEAGNLGKEFQLVLRNEYNQTIFLGSATTVAACVTLAQAIFKNAATANFTTAGGYSTLVAGSSAPVTQLN